MSIICYCIVCNNDDVEESTLVSCDVDSMQHFRA